MPHIPVQPYYSEPTRNIKRGEKAFSGCTTTKELDAQPQKIKKDAHRPARLCLSLNSPSNIDNCGNVSE
jgi:hypothetical protein